MDASKTDKISLASLDDLDPESFNWKAYCGSYKGWLLLPDVR